MIWSSVVLFRLHFLFYWVHKVCTGWHLGRKKLRFGYVCLFAPLWIKNYFFHIVPFLWVFIVEWDANTSFTCFCVYNKLGITFVNVCMTSPLISRHEYSLICYFQQKSFWVSAGKCVMIFLFQSVEKISSGNSFEPHLVSEHFVSGNSWLPLWGARIAQLVVLGLTVHSVVGSILLWGHFR